jgi:predicted Fe-Mo cluster-binding NifX family protein
MTKIAFATDDGRTISRHYGRARSFAVVTIEGGREASRELRPKANHAQFVTVEAAAASGAGHAADGERRHRMMLGTCGDCDAVVVGGIGYGALGNLAAAGVQPIATRHDLIDAALADWLAGRLRHEPDLVHAPSGMGPGQHHGG